MDNMYDESSPENSKPEAEEADASETALLPKSLFKGHDCKPGDKYTVEVVHVYTDEIEVRYVSEKKEEESESPMAAAESDLDGMASPA